MKRDDKQAKRRFLRGAQVVDTSKIAAAEERKRLRRQAKSRQGRARAARLMQLVFGVGALVIIISFLISRLFVTSVSVSEPNLERFVSTYLDSWPHQIKPFVGHDELEKAILQQFPTLESAEVKTSLFSNSLSVEAIERRGAAYWIDSRRGETFLIDSNAVVFQPVESVGEDLLIISDESGVDISLGDKPISQSSLSYFIRTSHALAEEGLRTDRITLNTEPLSFEINLQNKGFYLILSTERPLEEQIQDVREFFSSEQGSGVSQYADFRVSDKVFYR